MNMQTVTLADGGGQNRFFLGSLTDGPLTAAKKRQTVLIYCAGLLLALMPFVLSLAPGWKAAGLGLVFPGAGFLVLGPWAILIIPLVLGLFMVSLLAWFGSGMIIAPVTVWLGAAAIAGLVTQGPVGWPPLVVAFLLTGACAIKTRFSARKSLKEKVERRENRIAGLPKALADTRSRIAANQPSSLRELTPDQLAALRYTLDLALQPLESFDGFETIEQFQTSALRYQLNTIGYCFSVYQTVYAPNFHGYASIAQRNAIEKSLNRKVWGYWRWERLWGHLATSFDPVGRDNIMLTGFLGLQVALYTSITGDQRYTKPGSLTFRWGKHSFAHDLHSIVRSLDENYSRNPFCLYPCEPGWTYTPCNLMGMMTLIVYDRYFGTDYVAKHMPAFLKGLEQEFTMPDGDLVSLRSEVTGSAIPFPFNNDIQSLYVGPIAPERGLQAWSLARMEMVVEKPDGSVEIKGMDQGVDFGRYKKAPIGTLHNFLASAAEMGDRAVLEEVMRLLETVGNPSRDGGVLKYDCSSTLMISIVRGLLLGTGDWQKTVVNGPEKAASLGPILAQAAYPEVLVARAISPDSKRLEIVIYPGKAGGTQNLTFERLLPGTVYRVACKDEVPNEITADTEGRASFNIRLTGRTEIVMSPQ